MQSDNLDNSPKICMVLDSPFPPDIRVEKEARSLLKKGYEIHLLCMGDKYETKMVDNIIVHSIVLNRYGFKNRLLNAPYIINIFYIISWMINLLNLNNVYHFSLLHSHDLTTAFYTILIGKLLKIPVIIDMHENYPEALKEYRSAKKDNLYDIIFRNIFLHKMLERFSVLSAYHVFVVVNIRKEQLIMDGYNPDKISVITNAVDVNYISKFDIDKDIVNNYNNFYTIVYVGGVAPHRGIASMVKAVPFIKNKINNLKILIIGGKDKNVEPIQKLCEYLKIEDYVDFIGWVEFSKVPSYIFSSDVCVVPHKKSGHTDSTIPHKIFQYMYFKKPVIVTNCIPLKRIVEKNNCGLVVQTGDHKEMAVAIISLNDETLAKKLGANGKKAVLDYYSWEKTEIELIRLYEKCLSE